MSESTFCTLVAVQVGKKLVAAQAKLCAAERGDLVFLDSGCFGRVELSAACDTDSAMMALVSDLIPLHEVVAVYGLKWQKEGLENA